MENIFTWSSPVGMAIFLVGVGIFIWLLSKSTPKGKK
jgi:hypothetical protein